MYAKSALVHPAPEPNTTPLIDVLLVLLVLLILCLPVVTHQTTLTLPGSGRADPTPVVRVEIDFDGQVLWNGSPVADDERLSEYFRAVAADSAAPVLEVIPDRRARYGRVAQILAAAQWMHVTRIAVASLADGPR